VLLKCEEHINYYWLPAVWVISMFQRFVIVTRSAAPQKSPRALGSSAFEQKCAANLNIRPLSARLKFTAWRTCRAVKQTRFSIIFCSHTTGMPSPRQYFIAF
jgi:hypothetical protein